MRARRWPVTLLIAYALLLGHAPPPAAAAPGVGVPPGAPQRHPRPEIKWTPCAEDERVQCGVLRAPADWSDPYGGTVELGLARRPATDPAQRIGALLVNPGGPGGSAVNMALDEGFFGEQLRRRFDIVGLDPRGVGRSSPVLCDQKLVDAKPSPLIASERAYAETIAYNRRLAADCAARSGPVFGHTDTASVVRDLEAVRVALGEEQISFYGASYGSLIGQLYAERHPGRLRALAMDSVMDHSVGVEDFLRQETEAAQDSFDEFVAWCGRDARCVLRGRDIRQIWAELLRRAAAGTLQDPYDPPARLATWELLGAAFSSFYEPQWFSFAHYLKDAYQPASQGRAERRRIEPAPHSFPAVICGDWRLPSSGFAEYAARLRRIAGRAPQMLASPLALSAAAACLGWPVEPANPQFRLAPAAKPVLLVNSRHDPATAHVWAEQVAAQLGPRARLLSYQGWGHIAYKKSECVRAAVDEYLLSLRLPAAGASCPPVEPEPFGIG